LEVPPGVDAHPEINREKRGMSTSFIFEFMSSDRTKIYE
jgi:hypothetical protein